jgi:hypothetical protein
MKSVFSEFQKKAWLRHAPVNAGPNSAVGPYGETGAELLRNHLTLRQIEVSDRRAPKQRNGCHQQKTPKTAFHLLGYIPGHGS